MRCASDENLMRETFWPKPGSGCQAGELLRGVREEDLVHGQVPLRQDGAQDPVQSEHKQLYQGKGPVELQKPTATTPTTSSNYWSCAATHCKTAEVHVLLNFKSTESGLMTNVITSTSF